MSMTQYIENVTNLISEAMEYKKDAAPPLTENTFLRALDMLDQALDLIKIYSPQSPTELLDGATISLSNMQGDMAGVKKTVTTLADFMDRDRCYKVFVGREPNGGPKLELVYGRNVESAIENSGLAKQFYSIVDKASESDLLYYEVEDVMDYYLFEDREGNDVVYFPCVNDCYYVSKGIDSNISNTDGVERSYFPIPNIVNPQYKDDWTERLFNGKIKDAIDSVRRGYADGIIMSKSPFTSSTYEPIKYVDTAYGDEVRTKTIAGFKDCKFGYKIMAEPMGFGSAMEYHHGIMRGALRKNERSHCFTSEAEASAIIAEAEKEAKEIFNNQPFTKETVKRIDNTLVEKALFNLMKDEKQWDIKVYQAIIEPEEGDE